MGGKASCARCALGAINCLFFLAGVATLVPVSYILGLGFMEDMHPVSWALSSGLFLIMLSLCGSIGGCCVKPATTNTCCFRAMVGVYILLVLIVVVGTAAPGVILLVWHGELGSSTVFVSAIQKQVEASARSYYEMDWCCGGVNATTCIAMQQSFLCSNGEASFVQFIMGILQRFLQPAGTALLILGVLSLFAAVVACCSCRRVQEENRLRYAHLLISEDDADAAVYQRIAGVPSDDTRRRSSSSRQSLMGGELEYAIDGV